MSLPVGNRQSTNQDSPVCPTYGPSLVYPFGSIMCRLQRPQECRQLSVILASCPLLPPIVGHSRELSVTPASCPLLPPVIRHSRELSVTPASCPLLPPIVGHSRELSVTPASCPLLPPIVGHSRELSVIPASYPSFPRIVRYSRQLPVIPAKAGIHLLLCGLNSSQRRSIPRIIDKHSSQRIATMQN